MSLYLSGTDTSGSQIYWAFLYMVLYPDVQQQIYQEIKQNVGKFVDDTLLKNIDVIQHCGSLPQCIVEP